MPAPAQGPYVGKVLPLRFVIPMRLPRESVVAFAERVVALEIHDHPGDVAGIGERMVARLHAALGRLVGTAGFDALIARTLVLARRRDPLLSDVRPTGTGGIAGFREAFADQPERVVAAAEVLLAQFVELLCVLVGQDLAMHLVLDAWPASAAESVSKKGKR
jgi:hypothetical protein